MRAHRLQAILLLLVVFILSFPFYSVQQEPGADQPAHISVKADYYSVIGSRVSDEAPDRSAVIPAALLILLFTIRTACRPLPQLAIRTAIPQRLRTLLLFPLKFTSTFLI